MNQWNDHTFVICAYGDSPFRGLYKLVIKPNRKK